jgi:uncharacterized protein (TIGR02145 family)
MKSIKSALLTGSSFLILLAAISFSSCTKEEDEPTTVVDIDGNVYRTVTIGVQVWMAENLKVTRFRNGEPLSQITNDLYWEGTTEAAFCSPFNDLAQTADYGRLYNGYAITDPRDLAPEGWHIATDAEWSELIDHAGGELVAGGKLKEIGFTHWQAPNTDATNEFGFTALPSGVRLPGGEFSGNGTYGCFWSTTFAGSGTNLYWVRCLWYNHPSVDRRNDNIGFGFAVRCVKD